jgi:hypothetical protein
MADPPSADGVDIGPVVVVVGAVFSPVEPGEVLGVKPVPVPAGLGDSGADIGGAVVTPVAGAVVNGGVIGGGVVVVRDPGVEVVPGDVPARPVPLVPVEPIDGAPSASVVDEVPSVLVGAVGDVPEGERPDVVGVCETLLVPDTVDVGGNPVEVVPDVMPGIGIQGRDGVSCPLGFGLETVGLG